MGFGTSDIKLMQELSCMDKGESVRNIVKSWHADIGTGRPLVGPLYAEVHQICDYELITLTESTQKRAYVKFADVVLL